MSKLRTLLTCILFICSVGTSEAAPPDSPGTVYMDGLPCNIACQSYMAWSRQLSMSRQASVPAQFARQASRARAQRPNKISTPNRAALTRVARKVTPRHIESSPASLADRRLPNRGEAKSVSSESAESLPVPNPSSASGAGTPPGQAATSPVVEDLTTASVAPKQNPDSDIKSFGPAEGVPPADAETAALAPPNNTDQLVAVLLVRSEIASVSDLANKIVAIDVSRSDSVADVRTAMVAAGATEIQMSEGETLAFLRVIDGEVPAAVVTVAPPEEAEIWAEVPGFKILRIPLSPSEKAGRG